MITESMTIQGLQVIFWALIPIERWKVARCPLNNSSAAEVVDSIRIDCYNHIGYTSVLGKRQFQTYRQIISHQRKATAIESRRRIGQ